MRADSHFERNNSILNGLWSATMKSIPVFVRCAPNSRQRGHSPRTKNAIDPSTGNLLVAGKPVFPLGLSDPPPLGSTAPNSGLDAWKEIAGEGAILLEHLGAINQAVVGKRLRRPLIALPGLDQHVAPAECRDGATWIVYVAL